ncbi:uncharacterized protein LOC112588959 [Harpegnathos saltator]|uniref:uncharacterized protein LOC112588959 n=1 Tax=Harpegnathos saltator TaxID=610380 RepID=UPI000DBEDD5B|nr:uncharacterized protein LOC112588959 [Harpegnathos saltator]
MHKFLFTDSNSDNKNKSFANAFTLPHKYLPKKRVKLEASEKTRRNGYSRTIKIFSLLVTNNLFYLSLITAGSRWYEYVVYQDVRQGRQHHRINSHEMLNVGYNGCVQKTQRLHNG